MRFLNWDVLIFPDESRIPIQEFDVKCHALVIPSDNLLASRHAVGPASHHGSVTQVPNLTGFIPSLDAGQNFRVSIHTWEKAQPSDLLLSFKPPPDRIVFEAKLYVDGDLKAQRFLSEESGWPEVINTTGHPGSELCKQLRFPPFHSQFLQQSHWDANEQLGRIRVVIAEGVRSNNGSRSFQRLRDVVAFSFQHAPRHILEHSGIAWPNPRMFERSATHVLPRRTQESDAHAHTPSQTITSRAPQARSGPTVMPIALHSVGTWPRKPTSNDDPFVSPPPKYTIPLQAKKKTDVSMQDVGTSSRNQSEMSGVATAESDFSHQLNQAGVDEILRDMQPEKKQALLAALGQPRYYNATQTSIRGGSARPSTNNRIQPMRAPEPHSRLASSNGPRKLSSESRKSSSGQSTSMSWDETPTLGDLWSGTSSNDFSGMLPSVQRCRSVIMGSKRKRSISPSTLEPTMGDTITVFKGMSTSPCKKAATPAKVVQVEEDDQINVTPVEQEERGVIEVNS